MSPSTKIGYLSLPREIRDQIMELALHPGEVQIHANHESLEVDLIFGQYVGREAHHRYSVQLSATCRQVYEESHRIWYGKNTFHITTFSFEEMKRVLGVYQKKHLGMMESLVVDCTIHDICKESMDRLKRTVEAIWDSAPPQPKPNDAETWIFRCVHGDFQAKIAAAMKKGWRAKSHWLRMTIPISHRMLVNEVKSDFCSEWPFRFNFPLEEEERTSLVGSKMELVMSRKIVTEIEENEIFETFDESLARLFVDRTLWPFEFEFEWE
jgi:hypothetical protein